MSFILSKAIRIESKPKQKSVIFDTIVDEYPVILKFEYTATLKYGKVGNIYVENLNNGKRLAIKPHQCDIFENVDYEDYPNG